MDHSALEQAVESALKKVLGGDEYEGVDGEARKVILIKRIPIICQDILSMKGDLRWIKWLATGIAAGIGLLALKQLGV